MYSLLKSVQILIALLKNKGVQHVVISPGGICIPIVRSMEADPYFTRYSVVDERSAAYFAIGVAQSLRKPVAIVCTSGTAVCNYLSGVTEAFYQGVPLVVITADRHPYLHKQLETQTVNQVGAFDEVCRKSVTLPVVHDDNDFWYCQRLVNEALLELDHHGTGPVHINVPTGVLGISAECIVKDLPPVTAIDRVLSDDRQDLWMRRVEELKSYNRILVVFGQNRPYSERDVRHIESFFVKYNCVLSVEHLSNLKCEGALITYPVTETISKEAFGELLPDLVITLGYNFAGADLKTHMRSFRGKYKHWLIDEKGSVKDVFKSLSTIFECSPSEFFRIFAERAPADIGNNKNYHRAWAEAIGQIRIPDLQFSNLYVAQEFSKRLPPHSILHLSILNSIRHMQFFEIPESIEVFGNIGALGIDGSMSTFIGQAAVTDKLCFLLIGDLSFFYDMNSMWIKHLGSNVRILMVNNGGGGEFLFRPGIKQYPQIHDHVGARHKAAAKGWVESLGFNYCSASTKDELDGTFDKLFSPSDSPVFLEVFTNVEQDAEISQNFYAANRREGSAGKGKALVRDITKNMLGEKATGKVIKILRTIKE